MEVFTCNKIEQNWTQFLFDGVGVCVGKCEQDFRMIISMKKNSLIKILFNAVGRILSTT